MSSNQKIIDFNNREVISTRRNDGMFGGAFTKIQIKGSPIQFISSTMTNEELKQYIKSNYKILIH